MNDSFKKLCEHIYNTNKEFIPVELLLWEDVRGDGDYSLKNDILDYLSIIGRIKQTIAEYPLKTSKIIAFNDFCQESNSVFRRMNLPSVEIDNVYSSRTDFYRLLKKVLEYIELNDIPMPLLRTVFFILAKRCDHLAGVGDIVWDSKETLYTHILQYKAILSSSIPEYNDLNWYIFERNYNIELFSSIVNEPNEYKDYLYYSLAGLLPLPGRLSVIHNLLSPNYNYQQVLQDIYVKKHGFTRGRSLLFDAVVYSSESERLKEARKIVEQFLVALKKMRDCYFTSINELKTDLGVIPRAKNINSIIEILNLKKFNELNERLARLLGDIKNNRSERRSIRRNLRVLDIE